MIFNEYYSKMDDPFKKKNDYARDIDPVNYKLTIDRIKQYVRDNIMLYGNIKPEFELFSYDYDTKCPLTGYFIRTFFDGPVDNPQFFKSNILKNGIEIITDACKDYNIKVKLKKINNKVLFIGYKEIKKE